MALLHSIAVTFGRITTLLQVILYLPLTLDVAGQDAFLALSASLASYYAFLSTVRTLTRKTSLAWIGDFLAIFQFIVVPACLLVVFNVYSPPSESYFSNVNRRYGSMNLSPSAHQAQEPTPSTGRRLFGGPKGTPAPLVPSSSSASGYGSSNHLGLSDESPLSVMLHATLASAVSWTFFLARHVPPWWHMLLRLSSPVFSLLEGVATLLVIQVVGSFSRWMIASSLTRRPPTPRTAFFGWVQAVGSALTSAEFLQLFFLLLSALVYVISALALYVSFEGATRNRPGTAAATGAALSSTLWLTAIAFAVHRGNVIETSLMFAYVVWNVYQLSDSLSFTADPLALIRSIKVLDTSSPFLDFSGLLNLHLPPYLASLVELLVYALGQSARFIAAAGAALPKSVIVSLIYRLMVLYSASRILPLLKRQSAKSGWDGDGWASSSSSGADGSSDVTSSESESESESDSGTESDSSDSSDSDLHSRKKSSNKGKGKAREEDSLKNGTANEKKKWKQRRQYQQQQQQQGDAASRGRGQRRLRTRGIREEEPFGAFISLIVSYARLILIAVYSHLLLLDQSHMVYWRFLTVGITLFVWAFELLLGKDDNPDAAFAGSWRG